MEERDELTADARLRDQGTGLSSFQRVSKWIRSTDGVLCIPSNGHTRDLESINQGICLQGLLPMCLPGGQQGGESPRKEYKEGRGAEVRRIYASSIMFQGRSKM